MAVISEPRGIHMLSHSILTIKTCHERVQKAVPPGSPGPPGVGIRARAIESLTCDGHLLRWPLSVVDLDFPVTVFDVAYGVQRGV